MINFICFCLAMFGGINWLSIGIVQFDLIAAIFGSQAHILSRVIYILVGASCAYLVYAAIAHKGNIELKRNNTKQQKQDMLN